MIDMTLEESCYIKCYTYLDIKFKSKYVSKIIGSLEYWLNKPKYKNGFFKFLEPCKHRGYRPGDSWTEVIGISRKVFNEAFKKIGMSYNSKTQFEAQKDPFQGKMYARYYDRRTNKSHYLKDHKFAEKTQGFIVDEPDSFEPPEQQTYPEEKQLQIIEKSDSNGQKCRSWNDQKCRSFIANKYKQINTSSLKFKSVTQKLPGKTVIQEEMIKIWRDEIGFCSVSKVTSTISRQLQNCWEYFNKSLIDWRSYCQKIASSKFLMGENSNSKFKIWFSWAIQISTIENIESGFYSLGDRQVVSPATTEKLYQQIEKNILQQTTPEIKAFQNYLFKRTGTTDYNNWFQPLKVDVNSDKIIIECPNEFVCMTLRNRFGNLIEHAINHAFNENKPYEIRRFKTSQIPEES